MKTAAHFELSAQKTITSRRAAEEAIDRAKLSKTQSWHELLASNPNAISIPTPPTCIRPTEDESTQ